MSSAKHIYSIADNHAQTVQVCIDRLHQLHADQQLKRLAERLQKLATEVALGDGKKKQAPTGAISDLRRSLVTALLTAFAKSCRRE
jgi:hypothetical protein